MPTPIVRVLILLSWRTAAWLVALALGPSLVMGQASTDACGFTPAAQWTVLATCTPVAFTKPNAFGNDMTPTGCSGSNNDDAFAWFAGTGNPVTVTYTPPSGGDAVLHVLSGTCAAPTVVACSDNCCNGAVESVTIPTALGTNYMVRVQRKGGNGAFNAGTLCVFGVPPAVGNDNPCNATVAPVNPDLNCTSQMAGTLVNATPSGVATAPCGGTPNDDVWFTFVAVGTTQYIALNNVAGNTTDLYHAVFGGTCGNLTNISCSDPNNSTLTGLTIGQTYWVRVYSWSGAAGANTTFDLCITTLPPPPPVPNCGEVFYDPGGAGANYPNGVNSTVTICPSVPGNLVSLNFTSFSTEAAIDELLVYDGNTTAAPLIGTYSGTAIPPAIVATNATGCITAAFSADGTVNYPGWAANVSCLAPPAGACVYVLRLNDRNGNGWGSSAVGVRINGGPYTYYTVTAYSNFALFGVNLGDLIELNYVATGPNQNQNSYTLSRLGQSPYFSSNIPPAAGITFSQTVDCGPPPAQPQDCAGGITLCSAQAINNNSTSTGDVIDLNTANRGCLNGENQGTWYYFSSQTAGTIGFTIAPANGTDDYDFAVWGPYTSAQCPGGPPLRCSWNAPPSYNVGLGNGATDVSEGAGGDGWVQTIAAQAGDIFVMYIDNWSTSGQAFTLSWQLSGGSSLDCTTLPVELLSLEAIARDPVIDVQWATATELNSSHFNVQRSADNVHFTTIGMVGAAGNAQFRNDYFFTDQHPFRGANYYRLEQVDIDGTTMVTYTVVANLSCTDGRPTIFPNPATDLLNVIFAPALDGLFHFSILDELGRQVAVSSADLQRGQAGFALPLDALARGWYHLQITGPDGSSVPGDGFLKQ